MDSNLNTGFITTKTDFIRLDGQIYDVASHGTISVQNRGFIRKFWHYFREFWGINADLEVEVKLMEHFSNDIFHAAVIDV